MSRKIGFSTLFLSDLPCYTCPTLLRLCAREIVSKVNCLIYFCSMKVSDVEHCSGYPEMSQETIFIFEVIKS